MENKYGDGTVAQRGDVVVGSDHARYVVVNPTHSDGFVRLTTIGNPAGFTRTAPIDSCRKCVADEDEKQRAIEALKKVEG